MIVTSPKPSLPRGTLPSSAKILDFVSRICQEYQAKGYALTLRQVYYQGVTRHFWPSHPQSYDAVKYVIPKARLAGKFPLDALVDRTRIVHPGRTTRCDTKIDRALCRAADAAVAAPDTFLHRDPWFGQQTHVSVWFEKEALAGIFEGVCGELHVSSFSCHGDPSHPALYQWLRQAAEAHGVDNPDGWQDKDGNNHKGMAKRSVVLYFGDLDPTGVRIPRTAETTVRRFAEITGLDIEMAFVRVGITMEMAQNLDLPPFPAKQSAGKDYDNYVEEYGTTDAWELDALAPEIIEDEVRRAVHPHFDVELHDRLQANMIGKRDAMRREMKLKAWHEAATRSPE
jgi:hypothetical protein